jgi:hypothetical protein
LREQKRGRKEGRKKGSKEGGGKERGRKGGKKKRKREKRYLSLTPVATWEARIQRIMVPGQPRKIVHKTPSQPTAGCGGTCLSSQATWRLR